MNPLLEARDLVGYLEGAGGLRRVLDRAAVSVRDGRSFALLGESGSGKTFLAQACLGLHPGRPGLVAGSVTVLGRDVLAGLEHLVRHDPGVPPRVSKDVGRWDRAVARRLSPVLGTEVTVVPQDPATALPPFYPVAKLLGAALRAREPDLSGAALRGRVRAWLERVHMYDVDEVLRSYPHELSGGMAQRVALALALAPGPRLLVADEPTTGLDATMRIHILAALRDAVQDQGLTLLLITHDVEAARLLAEDVAVLCAGRVVEEGPAARVLDPAVTPKHPYTAMLLAAEQWFRVGGAVPPAPAAGVFGAGCGFAARCPRATGACAGAAPGLAPAGPGHRVACPGCAR